MNTEINIPCIVKIDGKYPIRFHTYCYEVVAESKATHFTSIANARVAARKAGLRLGSHDLKSLLPQPVRAEL